MRGHGDDGSGQGRALAPEGHQALLPQGRGVGRSCGSPPACTSSAARSSSRPSSTPAPRRAACARTSPRSSATQSEIDRRAPRRPAQGQPLPRARARRRRAARAPDRPGRRQRPSGPRPAHRDRQRLALRRRGRLARRVPGPRLADRAGPLVARSRSPAPGPRRRSRCPARPAGSASWPSPARCAASTASSSATATPSRRCSPGSAPTSRCWPGRSGACAARCAPPRTGSPTSTTPTCAARPAPPSPPAPGCTRALEILGDDVPDHLAEAGRLRIEHQQASLEELGALADPPMTKDAIAGRIRRLLALADKRAGELGHPRHRGGHPRRPRRRRLSTAGDARRGRVWAYSPSTTAQRNAYVGPIGSESPRGHASVPR